MLVLAVWGSRHLHAAERLLVSSLTLPVFLLAVRWNERAGSLVLSSQPSSTATTVLGHIGGEDNSELGFAPDHPPCLESTLDAILSSTGQLVPYDTAEITLWDEERQCCVTQGEAGDRTFAQGTEGAYRIDEGYTGWIIRHQHFLLVRDVQARRDVQPTVGFSSYPFQSYIGIPLHARGRFIGTLELASHQIDAWSEKEIRILYAIANQAIVAIENAQLYAETQRRAEQHAGLARIAALAASTFDLDELLNQVMDETLQLLEAEQGVLLIYDEEEDALVARYLKLSGADREIVDTLVIPANAERFEQSLFVRGGSFFSNETEIDPNIVPVYHPYIQTLGFRNFAGVALRLEEHNIGELYLGDLKHGFGREEVRLLHTVAGYLAGAIENSRLYNEAQRRAAALASLTAISAAMSESLELDYVLQTIASAVLEVMGCQRSAIFVLDEPQQVLRLAMTQGLSEDYAAQSQTLTLEPGGRGHAMASEEPLIVSDIQADESLLAFASMSVREGFRAFADLPLKRADRVIGMLSAMFVKPHRFSRMEVELLSALADQAAIAIDNEARSYTSEQIHLAQSLAVQAASAIENARLYDQAQREIAERARAEEALRRLQRVSREINATVDHSHILDLVLEEALRQSNASFGAIVLRDAAEGKLQLEVCSGYSKAEETHIRTLLQTPEKHPAIAGVLDTGRALLLSEIDDKDDKNTIQPGARSVLLVPIFHLGDLAGLIALESPVEGTFDQGALEFVEGLSAQAAMAIGNAHRYQEQLERGDLLRQRADRLAAVLEVSQALRSDRPLEEILEEIAYAIQESVGFNLVLIGILEGDPPYRRRVAAAGLPIAEFERLKQVRDPWSVVADVMTEEFCISRSYYIPAERQAHWRGRLDVYEAQVEGASWGPERWHPQDLLLVPLIGSGGDIQGLLSVDQPIDGLAPTRETVEALEIFADQAALAIENATLMDALQRRAEMLTLFNEVNRATTAHLEAVELSDMLDAVAEMIPQLLEGDYSSIFLLDAESGHYVARAAYGFALEDIASLTFTSGEGLVGAVAESGMPLAIDDVQDDARSATGFLGAERGAAVMSPLTVGRLVVGVLCVGRYDPRAFKPAEVATLSALADQVAVAVENARLFDAVRRFSQEMERRVEERTGALAEAMADLTEERDRVETLYRITSQLTASLDLDHVMNLALRLVVDAVGAERASILMLDSESDRLIYRAALGTEDRLPVGGLPTRFSSGEGLAGWIVENREAIIVPDIRHDPRWVESRNSTDRIYRSALAVPLTVSDEVLGALLLFHTETDHFDESHLRLVKTAGVQVANALNNAELYKLIFDQAERLGNTLKAQKVEATKSQAILEGVADGVIVADADGQIILFNAAAERILELPREQAMGRSINEMLGLYGSRARDWLEKVVGWAERAETYSADEYLAARLEIGARIVSVHLAPVLMDNEFLGTVSAFRDVTAEVEAERAKTEFVSTVSHELRTPMTSIKGYVDLLLMGAVGVVTEDQQNFLSVIRSNVERLTLLVSDLLDISRVESGRLAVSPKVIHLEEVIDLTVVTMRARAMDKGLTLQSEVSSPLPQVLADPDRVTQILTNLMGNACSYTPAGGRVTVSAYAHSDEVHVSVSDTGIGISEEDQEKIFDRFFRADHDVVQDAPGAGLGLSIVKSLTEMQGGRVWVNSDLGKGSTFTVAFPAAAARQTLKQVSEGQMSSNSPVARPMSKNRERHNPTGE